MNLDAYKSAFEGIVTQIDSGNQGETTKIIATQIAQVGNIRGAIDEGMSNRAWDIVVASHFGTACHGTHSLAELENWANLRILAASSANLL